MRGSKPNAATVNKSTNAFLLLMFIIDYFGMYNADRNNDVCSFGILQIFGSMKGMDYETLAKEEVVERVMSALAERGVTAELVSNRAEALERLKALIPQGVSIMNGSSRTLEEIGFVDYVKSGKHSWNNLHQA